jgi:hypothetical protein
MTSLLPGHGLSHMALPAVDSAAVSMEQHLAEGIAAMRHKMLELRVFTEKPPFDPAACARALGMKVQEIRDPSLPFAAALLPCRGRSFVILVNTYRASQARRRFSIAHEIAHTLLPNAMDAKHYREGQATCDDREIERLADQGAAMLLMPPDLFAGDLADLGLYPSTLLELSQLYGVSLSAAAVNAARTSRQACAICLCSCQAGPAALRTRLVQERKPWSIVRAYRSATFPISLYRGKSLPDESVVAKAAVVGREIERQETLYFRRCRSLEVHTIARPLQSGTRQSPRVLAVFEVMGAR